MSKPSARLVLKTAMLSIIREMLYLPLWWYTTGARATIGTLLGSVKGSVRYFGVGVWAKNVFVPMYGDDSFAGRVISFIVRLVVLVSRSLGVLAWGTIVVALCVLYLIIAPVVIIGFISQLILLAML